LLLTSVALEEVNFTVILLPLVIFRAGTLDAVLLLPCLPLHHTEAPPASSYHASPYTTLKREVKEEDEIQARATQQRRMSR
jgi:hypothetical protein